MQISVSEYFYSFYSLLKERRLSANGENEAERKRWNRNGRRIMTMVETAMANGINSNKQSLNQLNRHTRFFPFPKYRKPIVAKGFFIFYKCYSNCAFWGRLRFRNAMHLGVPRFRMVDMNQCLVQRNVYSSSSPPAAAREAARFLATRPGGPCPYGELVAKSMCFSDEVRTLNDGTFTN